MSKVRMIGIMMGMMVPALLFAQDLEYRDYDWKETPEYPEVTPGPDDHTIMLKDKRALEFAFEGEGFYEYELTHKVFYVCSEKGIEMNNQIYLPFGINAEALVQKARVKTKEGEVIELDKSDIKEATNEEGGYSFRYFAAEGVGIGSYIEYIFLVKRYPSYRGVRETLQSTYPKKNVSFELISPAHLYFKFKSYNGYPEMEEDTTTALQEKEKNRWFASMDEIPALEEESNSAHSAHLMHVIYKLERSTTSADMSSYGQAATFVYEATYADMSKSRIKKLNKLLKETGYKNQAGEEGQIRAIENYVKSNFNILPTIDMEDLGDVDKVMESKVANSQGILRLFCNLFEVAGIEHQIVLTSDRLDNRFDPEFEAYLFLDSYIIFFPKPKTFMAPDAIDLRLGYAPAGQMNNYGLFIKPVKLGDMNTGVGKVKFIPPLADEKTTHDTYVKVNFSEEDIAEANIELENHSSGYYAQGTQPFFKFLDEERQIELGEQLLESISGEADLNDLEMLNIDPNDFGVKPQIIKANFASSDFMEKAGKKYLFKVGELIGPQVEMYDEKERVLDIESTFNRKYYREITFEIPDGYDITNLDQLKMNIVHEFDGENVMGFTSRYEVNGNEVKVMVEEYYRKIVLPVSEYEAYRKVINAAADFNKIILFVEPKG